MWLLSRDKGLTNRMLKEAKNTAMDGPRILLHMTILSSLCMAIEASCDEGWWPYENSCYSLLTRRKTFEEAVDTCSSSNATLVSLGSQEEFLFLRTKLEQYRTECLWIGLRSFKSCEYGTRESRQQGWTWLDGTPFAWTSWREDRLEPGKGECYACVGGWSGKWYGSEFDDSWYSLCEKKNDSLASSPSPGQPRPSDVPTPPPTTNVRARTTTVRVPMTPTKAQTTTTKAPTTTTKTPATTLKATTTTTIQFKQATSIVQRTSTDINGPSLTTVSPKAASGLGRDLGIGLGVALLILVVGVIIIILVVIKHRRLSKPSDASELTPKHSDDHGIHGKTNPVFFEHTLGGSVKGSSES